MKRIHFAYLVCLILTVLSCGHVESKKNANKSEYRIHQQANGIISLELDKAGRYTDLANPSNNTADWNVVISKPGLFKVWVSSITKDTADLRKGSLRINILDNQLEGAPQKLKIVQDGGNTESPYFRADSFMGTVFVLEPGEYNIQVISEKVFAQNTHMADTKLLSIMLMPDIR